MKQFEEEWLDKIDNIIESNLHNSSFQISDIAEELAISKAKIYRKLSKLKGVSPSQYIKQKRLAKAKEVLEIGVFATVRETAESVGYSQPEYFTKLFFREYQILPKDILKKNKT